MIYWRALVNRRRGRWDEAVRGMRQALARDPRDGSIISESADTLANTGHFAEATRTIDDALKWDPLNFGFGQLRANLLMWTKADLAPWKALNESEAAKAASETDVTNSRFTLAMLARDYSTAGQLLATDKVAEFDNNGNFVPKEWSAAIIANGLGDEAKAKARYAAARERAAVQAAAQPESASAQIVLGQLDAALGRKAEAIREADRATELLPIAKDAVNGPQLAALRASVYGQVGETDRSLELLDEVARLPYGGSYGELKLDRKWDPLRNNPRFEKILASMPR